MIPFARAAAFLALAAALAAPASGQAASPAAPASVTIRFESDPLVECYFYLRTYSRDSIRPDPALKIDFSSEASAFARTQGLVTDPAVWRWFDDLVVAGPDVDAIREKAKTLPAALDDATNRTGVNMLVDSMHAAFPKFMQGIWPIHQKSLNRHLVTVRRQWAAAEPKASAMLMGKLGFSPIDAPVTVYTVVKAGRAGSWGKTEKGYYTIIGQYGQSSLSLIETGLHEATHVVESMQPFTHRWLLRQVRQGLPPDAPEAADAFLHGLVAYNAGALVKRFVDRDYLPVGVRAPAHAEEYRPYLSTYEVIWDQYLDGKIGPETIGPKLVEEFKAVRKLQAPAPPREPARP